MIKVDIISNKINGYFVLLDMMYWEGHNITFLEKKVWPEFNHRKHQIKIESNSTNLLTSDLPKCQDYERQTELYRLKEAKEY